MSSDYYSLEKASEVLGLPTAEILRLRDSGKLRAYRDGASWKFKKVEIDNHLAEIIKNRGKAAGAAESDFDLLGMDDDEETPTLLADAPSFDSILEDASVGENMVDASPKVADDDDLFALADDDLSLAEDNLSLAGGGVSLAKKPDVPSASDVDLATDEDDLVLDGGGSSAKIDLAGDSGLSLLDADDVELQSAEKGGSDVFLELDEDDDILSLVGDDMAAENTSTIQIPVEEDFQLSPDAGMGMADDSESASQVIALDDDNMFGSGPVDNSTTFGAANESPFTTGVSGVSSPESAFGDFSAAPTPGEFTANAPAFSPAPTSTEASYSGLSLALILLALVGLTFSGIVMLDLIIHIWSWGEPFIITGFTLELLKGILG